MTQGGAGQRPRVHKLGVVLNQAGVGTKARTAAWDALQALSERSLEFRIPRSQRREPFGLGAGQYAHQLIAPLPRVVEQQEVVCILDREWQIFEAAEIAAAFVDLRNVVAMRLSEEGADADQLVLRDLHNARQDSPLSMHAAVRSSSLRREWSLCDERVRALWKSQEVISRMMAFTCSRAPSI